MAEIVGGYLKETISAPPPPKKQTEGLGPRPHGEHAQHPHQEDEHGDEDFDEAEGPLALARNEAACGMRRGSGERRSTWE